MDPQTTSPLKASNILGAILVVLALLAGAAYVLDRSFSEYVISLVIGRVEEKNEAWESVSLIESGDFAKAAQQAEKVIEKGGPAASIAGSAYDVGTFYTGTLENRIKAIQFTKKVFYESEGDSLTQALKVNKLLSFIQIGMDVRVHKEIFKGEPFERLWVPKDLSRSIKNLAEFSLSLHQTNNAHFHTAVFHVDRIRNLYGSWNATPAEKKKHADEILRIIGIVDDIFAENTEQVAGRAFDYMERFFMMYSKVFFYSAVSRVYPQYLSETKTALMALEVEYEAMKMRTGGYNAFAATRMPDAYFAYAAASQQVKGKEVYTEVAATLDKLVAFVESDPKPHEGFYLSYIRQDRSKWTKARRERALRAYYDLAEAHPPFKQFLERNGWTF